MVYKNHNLLIYLPLNINKMKEIKNIILMTLIVMLGNIALADNPVELRIDEETATVGDFINIPVYVDNSVSGEGIYAYQFKIQYYSSRLEFISIITTGTMTESWGNPTTNSTVNDYLAIAGAGSAPLSGTGVLFYMRFKCKVYGWSPLYFHNNETDNFFNEGDPAISFDNGSINIAAQPTISVSPNTGVLAVGETLQFNTYNGTAPYTYSLTNSAVASINSSGLLTATAHGYTQVIAQDNNGTIDTTGVIEIRAMEVSIHDTTEWQGGNINIPVYVTSLSGLGVMSGNIRFTFNENILDAVSIVTTGAMLDGFSISFNNSLDGVVDIGFAGTTTLSGSGILFYINFDISAVNTGGTYLSFAEAIFNEDLMATTDNGYFSMTTYNTIYLSPSTGTLIAGQTLQFSASNGISPYTWTTSNASIATINGSGLLSAISGGVVQITVTDAVGSTTTSGNITIYDTHVSLPHVYASLGTQYEMPLLMSTLPTGQEVFSLQGSITCEDPELSILSLVTTGTMTSGWSFSTNIDGNTIHFAGAGSTPFSTIGTILKIRFQLTANLVQNENAWVHIDDIVLNEGTPLPYTSNGSITGANGIILSAKVLLEGPFENNDMNTELNPWTITNTQPFSISPWSYYGGESFAVVPNADVVDWVLVELRETTGGASTATQSKRVDRKAGFLLKDGSIVGLDGSSNLIFNVLITNNLYVVIWHRNHLGIMSSSPATYTGGIYSYDFTTASTKAYGTSAQVSLGGGKYGMYAGDADKDGTIDQDDIDNVWDVDSGKSGYYRADMNLDGQVENQDKNDVWLPNVGKSDFVPN